MKINVSLETVLLTGGIIVVDVYILNEYLKLEEQLRRVKETTPVPELTAIAQEVIEPLPEAIYAPGMNVSEITVVAKTDVERENEKLKADKDALLESKKQQYAQQLDDIGEKIDNISTSVDSAKEKIVQYS